MRTTRINAVLRFGSLCLTGVIAALPANGCPFPPLFEVPTDFQSFFETLMTFAMDALRQVLAAWLF